MSARTKKLVLRVEVFWIARVSIFKVPGQSKTPSLAKKTGVLTHLSVYIHTPRSLLTFSWLQSNQIKVFDYQHKGQNGSIAPIAL